MAEWGVLAAYALIFGPLFIVYLLLSARQRRRSAELSRRADEERAIMDRWWAATEPCPICAGSGRVGKERAEPDAGGSRDV